MSYTAAKYGYFQAGGMGRSSVDLSCSEQGEEVTASTPWHLCSPTFSWQKAASCPTMTQQTESFDDVQLQCKQQIMLMLKREQRGPQRRYGCSSHFVLTEEPRKLLVASINSAAYSLGFQFETVALSVNLLDRFAATERLTGHQSAAMPLAAIACMSLAAKLEEVQVPDDLSSLQASMPWLGVHVADDIKKMEWLVAAALDWRCLALTPANFLDQLLCDAWQGPFSFVQQEDAHHFARAREFALAILSSTLTEPMHLWFASSTQAASAILVAFQAVGLHEQLQDVLLDHWATLGIQQVEECAEHAAAHIAGESSPGAPCASVNSQNSTSSSSIPVHCPANMHGRLSSYASYEDAYLLEPASSLTSTSTMF